MRVIQYGKPPSKANKENEIPPPPWWAGRSVQCPACGTVIELTATDGPTQTGANVSGFSLRCPLSSCAQVIPIRQTYDRSGRIHVQPQ